MAFPEVYINGRYVGGWDYGYASFQVDATPYVKYGAENEIVVRCDTRKHHSRWYPGAGIYRKVKMAERSRCAWFDSDAVFVTTPEITPEKASVSVQISPKFQPESEFKPEKYGICAEILAPDGSSVEKQSVSAKELNGGNVTLTFSVSKPLLWDVNAPNLYTLRTSIINPDTETVYDDISVHFGIRTIQWTADDGFHLNGRRVQLYGVNLHHDQGILGAAAEPQAMERQLKIMKSFGVNAIRTSHNPAAPEFMDLCDRMGFIVWNELFDKWDGTADLLEQKDFDGFMERQIKNFVLRDRNRPCVCLWSVGNEIADIERNQNGSSNPFNDAVRRVKYAANVFRKYDSSRKIALGCFQSGSCNDPKNHVRDSLDVTGWNYVAQYRNARKRYPQMPLVYSESASAVSTRGYYELPHPEHKNDHNRETLQADGYDFLGGGPDIPDVEFDRMERDSYVAGEFVWTGCDYLGEPAPFGKEAKSSYFGIVDLVGIPKDRYYLYRSHWLPETPTVHILPHWNWTPGQNVPVYVYTNGDSAELFLNGKSLGIRKKHVKYEEPVNLAAAPEVLLQASSEEKKDLSGASNTVRSAVDSDPETRWCASSESPQQWFLADMRKPTPIRAWFLDFEQTPNRYLYRLEVSDDAQNWIRFSKRQILKPVQP